MVGSKNPEKFRDEAKSLMNYSSCNKARKTIFNDYSMCMGLYFLTGDYEYRKKAVRLKNKIMCSQRQFMFSEFFDTLCIIVKSVQKRGLKKYKHTKKLDLY